MLNDIIITDEEWDKFKAGGGMLTRVVVISGYFSPIHGAHCEYAKNAKELAGPNGLVYAIVNNDYQSILKKGYSFIPENDRLAVVSSLKYVDKAFLSIDTDRSVCKTLQNICDKEQFKPTHWFNEADVNINNRCPEELVCEKNKIIVSYGSSPKTQSSSWILEKSVKAAYDIMFKVEF
jgi:D-beta-D-heptose 7-phosphate kinase/D-beta-D-heptose 1-phosphate adenosyltransferase